MVDVVAPANLSTHSVEMNLARPFKGNNILDSVTHGFATLMRGKSRTRRHVAKLVQPVYDRDGSETLKIEGSQAASRRLAAHQTG